MGICIICKKEFIEKRKDQTICKSHDCTKELNRIWRAKNKPVVKKRRVRCSECKKLFTPIFKKQKTCGSDICQKSRKNNIRKVDLKEFYCEICKDKAFGNKNAVLCGKKSCRQEYVNKFNTAGKYKQKMIKKVNKNASVSGRYNEEEISFMLLSKAKGFTYSYIAKKLKRKLESVDKKMRNLLTITRYYDMYEQFHMQNNFEEETREKNKDIKHWNERLKKCF